MDKTKRRLLCRAIDNTSIQCLHGKVPVSRINYMKRLSAEAWTALISKVRYYASPYAR